MPDSSDFIRFVVMISAGLTAMFLLPGLLIFLDVMSKRRREKLLNEQKPWTGFEVMEKEQQKRD